MDQQKSNIFRQVLVAVTANLLSICLGIGVGWSSPNIPKLRDVSLQDTPLDRVLTAFEVGWIGSLQPIGAVTSAFLAGRIADKFGRKSVMLLSGLIMLTSFIILGFGKHIGLILTARLMHGICVGLTLTVIPMYVGEISQVSIRGALGSLMMIFLDVGLIFSYSVGPFVPYVTFQFICTVFPITFLVLLWFLPETPTYYLLDGYKDKAIKSLTFLRNTNENQILTELELIQQSINSNKEGSWTQLFTNHGNRRALIICCGLMVASQASGIGPVIQYSQTIFIRASTKLAPAYASIIIALVPFVMGWCLLYTIERFGRKFNLLISAIGGGIGLSLLSGYFFLEQQNASIIEHLSFVPIVSLVIYLGCFGIGYGPVPWAIVGEIFTPEVKGHAATISTMTNSTCAAIIIQFFEILTEIVGPFWVFTWFTACLILGALFIHVYVIETKGLNIIEIQEKLNA